MKKSRLLTTAIVLCLPPLVQAESPESSKSLGAFRDVAAQASRSTVRVRCDGRDVALGTVVRADGWILTKASNLTGPAVVRLQDGRELPAKVIGLHEAHDIALLKIKARGLVPVVWRPSREVGVGSWVVSAGDDGQPVAIGVVSVGTRNLPTARPQLQAGGGFLGVSLDTGDDGDVRISHVVPGGSAYKAGLRVDDVILAIADKTVADVDTFLNVLQQHRPGDEIPLRIKRGDKELEVRVKLGKRPMDRTEFQNSLGSELSKRRTGFPTVLQHDSVVRPADCGGPLVDLDGRVIGINVCRAGRTASYTVPSEVLERLLPDLLAGRYPPPNRQSASK
jgi:serine protease Do